MFIDSFTISGVFMTLVTAGILLVLMTRKPRGGDQD
jgi:hypothetical protein